MQKKKFKLFIRLAAFLLLLAVVLHGLSLVLMPRTYGKGGGMHNYRSRGFYGEQINSIDVVAIGNSDLNSAFSPMEIWEQHGISAYACGEIKQQVNQAVYLLKEVLSCQEPKVVIFEVDSLFQESMKGHMASIVNAAVKYAFPVIEYHDRWKKLDILGLFTDKEKSWHDANKGYYYSDASIPYTGGEYMNQKDKRAEIDPMTEHYLDEFVSMCKKAGSEVVFVEMPSANSWSDARHDAVEAYTDKHGIPFVDFNKNIEETGFDWATDTRDGGNHLNHNGACKISAWLGNYLNTNYALADHRPDRAYAQWGKDLKAYKKNVKVLLENTN